MMRFSTLEQCLYCSTISASVCVLYFCLGFRYTPISVWPVHKCTPDWQLHRTFTLVLPSSDNTTFSASALASQNGRYQVHLEPLKSNPVVQNNGTIRKIHWTLTLNLSDQKFYRGKPHLCNFKSLPNSTDPFSLVMQTYPRSIFHLRLTINGESLRQMFTINLSAPLFYVTSRGYGINKDGKLVCFSFII